MTAADLQSEYYSWRTIKIGEIYRLLRDVDTFQCEDISKLGISLTPGPGPQRGRRLEKGSNVLILRKHYVEGSLEKIDPKSSNPVCMPIVRWIEVLESDQSLWLPIPTEWLSRREMILLAEHEANLDDLANKLGASYHRPV